MKRLPIDPSRLAAFCEANGIRKLSLFGSQLHGTARPDSDIDLLMEFHPDRIPSFFEVARMEREISEMLEAAHDLENFVFDESTGVLHSP